MADKRTMEQVRADIEVQRNLLTEDIAALRKEVRATLPFALGGMAALAVATKGRSLKRTLSLLRLLDRLR
jgi:hypothetical protein